MYNNLNLTYTLELFVNKFYEIANSFNKVAKSNNNSHYLPLLIKIIGGNDVECIGVTSDNEFIKYFKCNFSDLFLEQGAERLPDKLLLGFKDLKQLLPKIQIITNGKFPLKISLEEKENWTLAVNTEYFSYIDFDMKFEPHLLLATSKLIQTENSFIKTVFDKKIISSIISFSEKFNDSDINILFYPDGRIEYKQGDLYSIFHSINNPYLLRRDINEIISYQFPPWTLKFLDKDLHDVYALEQHIIFKNLNNKIISILNTTKGGIDVS